MAHRPERRRSGVALRHGDDRAARVSRQGDRQVRYSVGFRSALASAPVGMRCGKSRWDGRRLQAGLFGSGCLLERFERRKPRAQLLLLQVKAVSEGVTAGKAGGVVGAIEDTRPTPDRTGLVGFSRKCSEPSQAKEKAKRCARRARRLQRGVRRRVPLRGPEQQQHARVRVSAAVAVTIRTDPSVQRVLSVSAKQWAAPYAFLFRCGHAMPTAHHYSRTDTAQTESLHRRTALRCLIRCAGLRHAERLHCRIYPPRSHGMT
jgi:hypothetical protein